MLTSGYNFGKIRERDGVAGFFRCEWKLKPEQNEGRLGGKKRGVCNCRHSRAKLPAVFSVDTRGLSVPRVLDFSHLFFLRAGVARGNFPRDEPGQVHSNVRELLDDEHFSSRLSFLLSCTLPLFLKKLLSEKSPF